MRVMTFIQFPWILRSTTVIHRGTKTRGVLELIMFAQGGLYPYYTIQYLYTHIHYICIFNIVYNTIYAYM